MEIHENSFNGLFKEISKEVRTHKHSDQSEKTIEALHTLFKNKINISNFTSERDSNLFIRKITKLVPEGGFCVGGSKEDKMNNIIEKVRLLLGSYLKAKQENKLDDYFINAFMNWFW